MTSNVDQIQQIADTAIDRAAKFLLQRYGHTTSVKYKTSRHPTIKEDVQVEEIIVRIIKATFPRHHLVTEEAGIISGHEYTWYIDPIDGTRNFYNQIPLFVTQLAVAYKNEVIYSSIYAPITKEWYYAKKGEGAFLNQKPIQVSDTKKLNQFFITYGAGSQESDLLWLNQTIKKALPKTNTYRYYGSTGYELALLARGSIDASISKGGQPYDYLPGAFLVSQAGGKLTDLTGKKPNIKSRELCASNAKCHEKLINLIS
jgi:myo-inositol-1(or 4)-monophosphatase